MCDIAACSTAELDARLSAVIGRRLDAEGAEERARAADELLELVRELRRREVHEHVHGAVTLPPVP
ncbi:hypothetical protein [Cellulomonas sp. ATA003]|uniref:hypothetical protein n=1 Tax=Cellulomonas sp. ATA003 TaxID=3073064 RepID=UPI002873CB7C|nr:hypothetical protein [Cellulomonas sp. ATA003]WNB85716.1 hypothetical protein REH70_19795 [Cellulomonas sp. ATA003]